MTFQQLLKYTVSSRAGLESKRVTAFKEGNYRPVNWMSIICKIMEWVLRNCNKELKAGNIINANQPGFVENISHQLDFLFKIRLQDTLTEVVGNIFNIKYIDFYIVCDFDDMQYLITKYQQNNFYAAYQMD